MTYWRYLALFIVTPALALAVAAWRDRGRRPLPAALRALPPWLPITLLAFIALVYTTPWDNFLVATGVWYYDPGRVGDVIIGWVPLEEYSFFVLQTVLVGLWFLFVARRLPVLPVRESRRARQAPLLLGAGLWLAAVLALATRWAPGTYLGLELGWFLPPLALQLWFGGDILASRRCLVLAAFVPAVAYISATDALAIASGVWTISPDATLGISLGPLPLEELVFFSLTSGLICVGMSLTLSVESMERLASGARRTSGARTTRNGREEREKGCGGPRRAG